MASAAGSKACLLSQTLIDTLKRLRRKPSDIGLVVEDISVQIDNSNNPPYTKASGTEYSTKYK
jgi:hypothetical protein